MKKVVYFKKGITLPALSELFRLGALFAFIGWLFYSFYLGCVIMYGINPTYSNELNHYNGDNFFFILSIVVGLVLALGSSFLIVLFIMALILSVFYCFINWIFGSDIF